jgi:sterol desaturase/sphingolipid hydroxylase (fatty acid hydroxylase superfamily)
MDRRLPAWFSGLLVGGCFALLYWLELRRPLRQPHEPKPSRTARNLTVGAVTAVALALTERPMSLRLSPLVHEHRWGLLKLTELPPWLEAALAIVLLDYTLYLWHVATHRVPFLWRFHLVHHVDRELDASNALRFHCGEMVLSVVWRAGQIFLIGVAPLPLSIWQTLLLVEILFHHSNVRLPIGLERILLRFVVTPRMHGIHHSMIESEVNSNWSSGLTLWDRLHGTLRLDVEQSEIEVGVPAYRDAGLGLPALLALPFRPLRDGWPSADDQARAG